MPSIADIKIPQNAQPEPASWKDVVISPAANSLIGFDASKAVGNVTIGDGLSLVGGQLSIKGTQTFSGVVKVNGGAINKDVPYTSALEVRGIASNDIVQLYDEASLSTAPIVRFANDGMLISGAGAVFSGSNNPPEDYPVSLFAVTPSMLAIQADVNAGPNVANIIVQSDPSIPFFHGVSGTGPAVVGTSVLFLYGDGSALFAQGIGVGGGVRSGADSVFGGQVKSTYASGRNFLADAASTEVGASFRNTGTGGLQWGWYALANGSSLGANGAFVLRDETNSVTRATWTTTGLTIANALTVTGTSTHTGIAGFGIAPDPVVGLRNGYAITGASFAIGYNSSGGLTAASNGTQLVGLRVNNGFGTGGFSGVESNSISIPAQTYVGSVGRGLQIGNVTGASTNYAIQTGTGLASFGDRIITSSTITTAAAVQWDLGAVTAGAVTLDASNYVAVTIGGVAVKLLKAA
jgi:hypothetical protein